MWDFLAKLPYTFSFTLLLLAILAIVLIALRGRLKAKLGDKTIDLGDDKSLPLPSSTVSIKLPKRTCSDCILLIMGEREKFELQFRREKDRILKTQMIFAEKKLIEIQILLLTKLSEEVKLTPFQHKIVHGIMRDSFQSIKDELRRSFKDNGFYDLNGVELNSFIKDQSSSIINMMYQYVQNIDSDTVIDFDKIRNVIKLNHLELSSIISEMYENAKNAKNEIERRIDSVKEEFGKWVDNFVK